MVKTTANTYRFCSQWQYHARLNTQLIITHHIRITSALEWLLKDYHTSLCHVTCIYMWPVKEWTHDSTATETVYYYTVSSDLDEVTVADDFLMPSWLYESSGLAVEEFTATAADLLLARTALHCDATSYILTCSFNSWISDYTRQSHTLNWNSISRH